MNFVVQHILFEVVPVLIVVLITIFFATHAAQHVADPVERASWLITILLTNVFGATFYVFTKYRAFQEIGKGRLIIRATEKSLREFTTLSDDDRHV